MKTRSMLGRLCAGATTLLVLSLSAAPVLGAAPNPTILPAWPQDTVLGYTWSSSALPPTTMRSVVALAANDATASRASRAPSFVASSGPNAMSYGPSNPCGVNGLACFSRDPAHGYWHLWFRENGHRYDWGTLSWCEMTGSPNGCYEAETIAIDELGHVDGLDHHVDLPDGSDYLDAVVQAYSHARPALGWNATSFGRCDVAALQQLYGPLSWTTPYSTCLDLPTTLTLSATPTAATTSSPVTFTATLRSAGSGRLSGNPMAGRIVVLQQQSGTSWLDFATLSPSSTQGSYTASLKLKGTQNFRAVFRKPASEGARTATSSAVTVTVRCTSTPCPAQTGAGQP